MSHPITPCGELHAGTAGDETHELPLIAWEFNGGISLEHAEDVTVEMLRGEPYKALTYRDDALAIITCLTALLLRARLHLPLAAASWNEEPGYVANVTAVLDLIAEIDAATDSGQPGRMQVAGASGSDDPKGMQGDAS